MGASSTSETSVTNYQSTLRHLPEDCNFQPAGYIDDVGSQPKGNSYFFSEHIHLAGIDEAVAEFNSNRHNATSGL